MKIVNLCRIHRHVVGHLLAQTHRRIVSDSFINKFSILFSFIALPIKEAALEKKTAGKPIWMEKSGKGILMPFSYI